MHPSVEATLCDFIPHLKWMDWREDYHLFLQTYHVDDWGIEPAEFMNFLGELGKLRCRQCGERKFPYYIEGDNVCTKCESDNAKAKEELNNAVY